MSGDEVKAAAQRLLEEAELHAKEFDVEDQSPMLDDIALVARFALVAQRGESGGEGEAVRAALIGLAMRSFTHDGSFCWCDGPVLNPQTHTHDPECEQARAALAPAPDVDGSGG